MQNKNHTLDFTCAAVTPTISGNVPPFNTLELKLTGLVRNFSISIIGHWINCFLDLSSQRVLGIPCKFMYTSLVNN